jgi:hypothetical protein
MEGKPMRRTLLFLFVALFVWSSFGRQRDFRSDFPLDKSRLRASGTNLYFPLDPGYRLIYQSGKMSITTTVLNETRVIDGAETRAVEDRETRDGVLTELTRDYYAIDPESGDVYYFGEDVDVYRNGKVIGHEGAWLSGIGRAKFGLMMPGNPVAGMKFYQEQAPKIAMDRIEILNTSERVTTPAGTFDNCVHVRETSPIEKDLSDDKWYAQGIGCVRDGLIPLVKIEKP